jgi:hypothetical protein
MTAGDISEHDGDRPLLVTSEFKRKLLANPIRYQPPIRVRDS